MAINYTVSKVNLQNMSKGVRFYKVYMNMEVLQGSLANYPNSFDKIIINREKTYFESGTKGYYLEFMLLLDLQANQAFSSLFSSSSSSLFSSLSLSYGCCCYKSDPTAFHLFYKGWRVGLWGGVGLLHPALLSLSQSGLIRCLLWLLLNRN